MPERLAEVAVDVFRYNGATAIGALTRAPLLNDVSFRSLSTRDAIPQYSSYPLRRNAQRQILNRSRTTTPSSGTARQAHPSTNCSDWIISVTTRSDRFSRSCRQSRTVKGSSDHTFLIGLVWLRYSVRIWCIERGHIEVGLDTIPFATTRLSSRLAITYQ